MLTLACRNDQAGGVTSIRKVLDQVHFSSNIPRKVVLHHHRAIHLHVLKQVPG